VSEGGSSAGQPRRVRRTRIAERVKDIAAEVKGTPRRTEDGVLRLQMDYFITRSALHMRRRDAVQKQVSGK